MSGGMRCGSSAAVGTSFGPGKTWYGVIIATLGAVGTLVTGSTVGTVVTLGTATRGCWRKCTVLGWGAECGIGTGGCGWSGWSLMVERCFFRPAVGAPPFVGPQFGHKGQLVLGVGYH